MLSKIQIASIAIVLLLLAIVSQHEKILSYGLIAYLEHSLAAEVVIEGPLHIELGTVTHLSLEKISILQADANFSAKTLEVSVLSRSLFTGPLSNGPVFVSNFALDQGLLAVHSRTEEQQFDLDPGILLKVLDSSLRDFEDSAIRINRFSIDDSQLIYSDADQDVDLKVSYARLDRPNPGKLTLSLLGQLNQSKLDITAFLARDTLPTRLHLKGKWGEYDFTADGQVKNITPLENLDIVLDANGPSTRLLLDLIGAEEVRDGPLAVVAHLHDEQGKLVWFTHTTIGDLILHGTLTNSLASDDFQLEFIGEGPSLREAGALVDYLNYSEQPFHASGVLSRRGQQISLDKGEITLGDGHFEASGTLPSYPSWDNWQFKLAAKQFDLTILQPFSPCAIPSLPMDWTGNFSSNGSGTEMFQLAFADPTHTINIHGELGAYPEFLGSVIKINSKGLNLDTLTRCIGAPLTEPTPIETSLTVNRLDSGWQVQDWVLSSTLLTADANIHFPSDGAIEGSANITTHDMKALTRTLGLDVGLKQVPVKVDFGFAIEGPRLTINQGKARSETGKGTFSGHFNTTTASLNFGLNLELSGTDLQTLLEDAPLLIAGMPFSAKAKFQTSIDGIISTDTRVSLADNHIRLKGTFPQSDHLQGLSISVEGQGNNLEHLFGSVVPYRLPSTPFDITFGLTHRGESIEIDQLLLETGKQQLSGNLILDLAPNLSRTQGQLLLEGNSSKTLFQVMGFTPNFSDEAYKLGVNIEGDRDTINVRIKGASLGLSDLSGNISIVPGDVNQIEVSLTSKRLHLPTFIPALITATDNKKDPIAVKDRLIPSIELPWQLMSDLKLNFTHRADRVDLQPGNHARTELAFTIENGQLRSQDISWKSDKSNGAAVLVINQLKEDPTNADIQLEIVSERIPLLWLFTGTPVDIDGEQLQFNARLNSRGRNTLELTQNLSGLAVFRGGGGIINSGKLDTVFGDFLSQLTRKVFATAEKQTNVQCTGAAFRINNGKVLFDPALVVRTSRFDVFATGEINLPNEALELQLNSRSRQGIGVSAASSLVPNVGVVGTLAKPQVQISATGTAISGSAAIASGGLSILASGLWDRLRSSVENPCDGLYDRALKDPKAPFGLLVNGQAAQGT